MNKIKIETDVAVCAEEELKKEESELLSLCKLAAQKAYAVYSGFQVGCAVLLENGKIITGNNQENASYPAGICAERVAVMYANANYPEVPVVAMAISAYTNHSYTSYPVTPCGICRQVLLECENRFNRKIKIYLYGLKEIYIIESSTNLLPLSFNNSSLYNK